ncbi:SMI1/KNR4 family protein [Rubellicoccus peritrichatus]|uniref:SMI1/KNR4 family protein n=1 Tax=Rubellicoccus peritrichatus TaxID=3080537 RepID=A0AAQ3LET3_9BACT|nr:SMI1/KNR4 family protein [Puniceicoccus sp. CR14]WOO42625.1 SMI1/KNR4 family protein [Puniceicoccus sp. CR14]
MDLLSLNEVQERLLEQYEMLDGEIPELNMNDSSIEQWQLDALSEDLGSSLPREFSESLLKYDFGELNVGGIFFGQTGDYIDFLKQSNLGSEPSCWWGNGERPSSVIMIGGTDGYVLLLDCSNGEIDAFRRGEDYTSKKLIAANFELLVRGAGTVHFGRKKADDKASFGNNVSSLCNAENEITFWSELAQGIT